MSRFSTWFRSRFFTVHGSGSGAVHSLCLDVGSANTRVMVDGSLVFFEPTVMAIHEQTGAVVSIGTAAYQLVGKQPAHITLHFPVQYGAVVDQARAEQYFQAVFARALSNKRNTLLQLPIADVKVAVEPSLSVVQRKIWTKVLQTCVVGRIQLVDSAIALAQGYSKGRDQSESLLVIDCGAQTTTLSLLSSGGLVFSESIRLGGLLCTQIVQQELMRAYECKVGWQESEKCKHELGSVAFYGSGTTAERKKTIRGQDTRQFLVKTIVAEEKQLSYELTQMVELIALHIHSFLSQLPSDLCASALQRGVVLAGGASLLKGIRKYLEVSLQSPVIAVEHPSTVICTGLATFSSMAHPTRKTKGVSFAT